MTTLDLYEIEDDVKYLVYREPVKIENCYRSLQFKTFINFFTNFFNLPRTVACVPRSCSACS
jgi:hypothetical protein